jgi:hypothetical protein
MPTGVNRANFGALKVNVVLPSGLSQTDATWGIGCDSSGHVTPRRNGCNGFPPKSAADTRPVAARAQRTRPFSFAHSPKWVRQAHLGRTGTASKPLGPPRRTSPRGTCQPQPSDPVQNRRELLAGHRHFGQLKGDVLGVGYHLGPDLDELLPQRRERPTLDRLGEYQLPQEVGQVVGQGEQLQARLVVLEAPAR